MKYYWLKLDKGFFKRHDIRIVESMPNGKDYILFYLKLLLESVDHEGRLRFSDTIPYNDDMLSTITGTNVDIVRSAVKLFCELKLMVIIDDGTLFMLQAEKMIGAESEWAMKKRDQRKKEEDNVRTMSKNVRDKVSFPLASPIHQSTFQSGSILLSSEQEEDSIPPIVPPSSKSKPTLDDVRAYCLERANGVDPEQWFDFYTAKGWKIGKEAMKDWKAAVRTWEKRNSGDTPRAKTDAELLAEYDRRHGVKK